VTANNCFRRNAAVCTSPRYQCLGVPYLKRLTDEQWVIIDPSLTFRSLAAIAISFARDAMQFRDRGTNDAAKSG